MGYSITGSTREQGFVCHWGSGANGKSTLISVIQKIFAPIVRTASFTAFEKKSGSASTADLAALSTARMVVASEGERGAPMSEGTLKVITGSDKIAARHLYQEQFEYLPRFCLHLVSNYKPRFKGQDPGLWRRVWLLPYNLYLPPEDRNVLLEEELLEEAEGILRWVVDGAVGWYRTGLDHPDLIREGVTDYREGSDELAGFTDFHVVADPAAECSGADLYGRYRDWAIDEGILRPWSRTALYEAVCERMSSIKKIKRRDGIHFLGLGLVDEPHNVAEGDGGDGDDPLLGTSLRALTDSNSVGVTKTPSHPSPPSPPPERGGK
jgi:putative DNA primase/helicase